MARFAATRQNTSVAPGLPTPSSPLPPESPPARRLKIESRWRDPKLAAGIALVAGSVVAGSWLVASADDRVLVWSAAHDLASGIEIRDGDLVQTAVRLDAASAYIGVSSAPVVGRRLSRPIGAGEVVPLGAVSAVAADHRLITLPVEPLHSPVALKHGDRVDVYVSPRDAAGGVGESRLVLAGALVSDVTEDADSARGEFAAVLDVDAKDAALVVGAGRSGVIDLAGVPVGAL